MFKIQKKGLASFVATAIADYQSNGDKMHVAVVSALHNVSTSGDVTLINRIYENLRSNDQQALKMYVRRTQIVNGLLLTNNPDTVDGLPTAVIAEMLKKGSVIDYKKGAFRVINNPSTDIAKGYAKLLETRLINPDGENDRKVLERNNFAEHKMLGDADVLKAVLKPVNEALDNATDNKTFHISASVRKQLEKIRGMLDVGHQQATLDKG